MRVSPPSLEALRARVEPLETAMNEAWWHANISGSEAHANRSAEAQKRLTRLYAGRDDFDYLKSVDPESLPPDLARQHTLLLNAFAANQMDDATIEELVDTEKTVRVRVQQLPPPSARRSGRRQPAARTFARSDDTI
jgi:hypothetical protein